MATPGVVLAHRFVANEAGFLGADPRSTPFQPSLDASLAAYLRARVPFSSKMFDSTGRPLTFSRYGLITLARRRKQ